MAISKAKKIHSKSKFEFISNKIELLFNLVFEETQEDLMMNLSQEINSAIALAESQNNRVYIEKYTNVRYGSFADLRSVRSNVRFFHTNCYHSVVTHSDFNCSAGVVQEGGSILRDTPAWQES